MRQKTLILLVVAGIALFLAGRYVRLPNKQPAQPETVLNSPPPNEKLDTIQPHIQVVFALDATGSMSGLIAAAKEKIWSIAGSLTQTDPAPHIEVGLIFYRDRSDKFITLRVPLSQNLDEVYAKLMEIQAEGGGDGPESVNQGLYEAVEKFAWDSSQKAYKSIFLVGDYPPHMDYKNDIPYTKTCLLAKQKDIVLNTILMGNNSEAKAIWKEIANCNQGSFTEVGMNANDIVIATPYDDEIAQISDALDSTRYYYGQLETRTAGEYKKSKSLEVSKGAVSTAKAQRAEYNSSKSGKNVYYGANELLSDIKEKRILLDTIKEEELPVEIKDIPAGERNTFIATKIKQKDNLQQQLLLLMEKRKQYLDTELSKKDSTAVKNSFNNVIYDKMKQQAGKKNIKLEGKAKY